MVGDDPDCLVDLFAALALQGQFVFCGHGASYAGSCPGGGGWIAATNGRFQLIAKVFASGFDDPHPLAINKPERYRMKRLTEWMSLITALIRLADLISRTGWL